VPPALEKLYREIQRLACTNIRSREVGECLTRLYQETFRFLETFKREPLQSKVTGKKYFAFSLPNGKISRAVNEALFEPSASDWQSLLNGLSDNDFRGIPADRMTRAIYSFAIGFCSTVDLTKTGDQKTPGTFFQYLVGHLYATRLGITPVTELRVLNLDMDASLPTDFIFDLGRDRAKFHLPVKTSTRERVIQVWAHQRVLDGVYGTGRFLGTPVILAETKTDTAKREVVEICLPEQWRIYQMHIAQLKRIYYLDVPAAYARLNEVFPPLCVRPFGDFFQEADTLT